MEIDGVFKTLLLLKKKKYAAVIYQPPYNQIPSKTINEYKGLDLVRRDWCGLSKQVGIHLLEIILNPGPRLNENKMDVDVEVTNEEKEDTYSKEEVISRILDFMREVSKKMDNNEYNLDQYVITKQLTKKVEEYSDHNILPHVKVAKRLISKNELAIKPQSHIHYIICKTSASTFYKEETNSTSKSTIADRAFHIKEVEKNKTELIPDMDWYKENQILSSASRLLKHINELSMHQLSSCLDLKDKYKHEGENNEGDNLNNFNFTHEINDKYRRATIPLEIKCYNCNSINKIYTISNNMQINFNNIMLCSKCKQFTGDPNVIINSILLRSKEIMSNYYTNSKVCNKCNIVNSNLLVTRCKEATCRKGYYRKKVTEKDTADNINFQSSIFEVDSNETENNKLKENEELKLHSLTQNITMNIKNKTKYNMIDFADVFDGVII